MRYYELDAVGRILASYARAQPGRELKLLPEPPHPYHMRSGDAWVEDVQRLEAAAAGLLRQRLRDRFLDEIIERDASLAAAKGVLAANREAWLAQIKDELRGKT